MCHGNICRSPFAAADLARELAKNGVTEALVESAGVAGENRPTPDHGLAVAAEFGLDLSAHRSRLLTVEQIRSADLVIVMSEEQERYIRWKGARQSTPVILLGDLDPGPIDARTILDPWNADAVAFRASYSRIDRCIREIAALLR
jgi:protein-tyrosine phosphatase